MSAVKTDAELKGLRTRRDQAVIEVGNALQILKEAHAAHTDKKGKLDALNTRIKELESSGTGITISEHAYLRWIERAMGFDLAEIRKAMLPSKTEAAIEAMGSCRIKTEGGYTLVVKNRTVVSVVEE